MSWVVYEQTQNENENENEENKELKKKKATREGKAAERSEREQTNGAVN